VGRPPQELMRGWGITLIRKASRPDRGLGIRATHDLAERGEKGRCGGQRKNTPAKSAETGSESRGFKEDSKTKRSGYRKWQRRF
jgi:hypothetical protein